MDHLRVNWAVLHEAKGNTYYHVAPRENRDSIFRNGLNHGGESPHAEYMNSRDLPQGNYLFGNKQPSKRAQELMRRVNG